jgi:hypothetical protein
VRIATFIIALLTLLIGLYGVSIALFSTSDAATRGLDNLAGWVLLVMLSLTAAPALFLTVQNRAPRLALALALAFPAMTAAAVAFALAMLP